MPLLLPTRTIQSEPRLTNIVATLLGLASRLRRPQASVSGVSAHIHRRDYNTCSGSSQPSRSFYIEDCPGFWSRQRSLPRGRHSCRCHRAQRKSIGNVNGAARSSTRSRPRTVTRRCNYWRCKLALDLWISGYIVSKSTGSFDKDIYWQVLGSHHLFRIIYFRCVLPSRNSPFHRRQWWTLRQPILGYQTQMATDARCRSQEISKTSTPYYHWLVEVA